MRPRFLTQPLPDCPHPEKRAYRNRRDAIRALAQRRALVGHQTAQGITTDPPPTATYLCRCGAYHLTSQPQHQQSRKDAAA